MKWVDRLLAHVRPTEDENRARLHAQAIRKADRVIEDYRRLDGALRIVVTKKPQ